VHVHVLTARQLTALRVVQLRRPPRQRLEIGGVEACQQESAELIEEKGELALQDGMHY
jgi:hypothetical protein